MRAPSSGTGSTTPNILRRHLTNAAQRGAYMSLVCRYWVDGRLPADDDMLARIVGMSSRNGRKTSRRCNASSAPTGKVPRSMPKSPSANRLHERRSAAGRKGNAGSWGHRRASESDRHDSDCDRIYSTVQKDTAQEGPIQGEGTPLVRYSSNLSEGTNDADRRPRLTALAGGLTAAGKEDGR